MKGVPVLLFSLLLCMFEILHNNNFFKKKKRALLTSCRFVVNMGQWPGVSLRLTLGWPVAGEGLPSLGRRKETGSFCLPKNQRIRVLGSIP